MPKPLAKVKSLQDLRNKAAGDERYRKLLLVSARNLGGSDGATPEQAFRTLENNANETNEDGVVAEVNGCREFV